VTRCATARAPRNTLQTPSRHPQLGQPDRPDARYVGRHTRSAEVPATAPANGPSARRKTRDHERCRAGHSRVLSGDLIGPWQNHQRPKMCRALAHRNCPRTPARCAPAESAIPDEYVDLAGQLVELGTGFDAQAHAEVPRRRRGLPQANVAPHGAEPIVTCVAGQLASRLANDFTPSKPRQPSASFRKNAASRLPCS
jgi:hypothetical protein